MLNQLNKIHNKQFDKNRDDAIPVESQEFGKDVRYIIFNDCMAITADENGVLAGNMGQLEKLFKEALNVIEKYSGGTDMTLEKEKPTRRMKEYEKQKFEEHKQKFKKPETSFAEYEKRARAQGLSYGQLQGLERLGLK